MRRYDKLKIIDSYFYGTLEKNLLIAIVERNASINSDILEIGSGSGKGNQNQEYPKTFKCLTGIDIDKAIQNNRFLDEVIVGDASELSKYTGKKFDLIYSSMVAEHIKDPEKFLAAQLGSLKPTGKIIHYTVSRYYYTSILNCLVSERLKFKLMSYFSVFERYSTDTFPAFYRMNSVTSLRKLLKNKGVKLEVYRVDTPPGYLARSLILMTMYTLIHKPLSLLFPALKPGMIIIIENRF